MLKKLLLIAFVLAVLTQCKNEYPDPLYPPDIQYKPNPHITAFNPADTVMSGIQLLTIEGQNFSSRLTGNHVFFNAVEGKTVAASPTQITVQVPALNNMRTEFIDSVIVKTHVDSTILYADYNGSFEYHLTFRGLALEYGNFEDTENIVSMACSADETLYLTAGSSVYIVEPDSVKKKYTKLLAVGARSIRTGPGGYMYYVQDIGMFRVPPGGGTDTWAVIFPQANTDLDFDAEGRLYCSNKDGHIYRVDIDAKSNQSVATYPDSMQLTSLRVFDGAVYVTAKSIANNPDPALPAEAIWKNEIQADGSLGPNQQVFDWESYRSEENADIVKFTFDDQGNMLVAADAGDALTIVHTDGQAEAFYSSILFAPVVDMTWGNGKYLYLIANSDQQKKRLVKVDMQDMRSAPYYGR